MILPIDTSLYNFTSGFGNRPQFGDYHTGADWAPKSKKPTPIVACATGMVTFSGLDNIVWQGKKYQNPTIIIDHGKGITSLYAHMDRIDVKAGQIVAEGQVLGLCGAKGAATGIHLHFEIRVNGKSVDPIQFINSYNQKQTTTIMEAKVLQPNEYKVSRGGWRSHIIQEIIDAGLYQGTWQQNQPLFDRLNPVAPNGGWKAGDIVIYKDLPMAATLNPLYIQDQLQQILDKSAAENKKAIEEAENQRKIAEAKLLEATAKETALQETLKDVQNKLNEVSVVVVQEPATEAHNDHSEPILIDLGKLEINDVQRRGLSYVWAEFSKSYAEFMNRFPKWVRILAVAIPAILAGAYIQSNTTIPDLTFTVYGQTFTLVGTFSTWLVFTIAKSLKDSGDKKIEEELKF